MDQIITNVKLNDIVMISGPTGSGKSTKVPKILVENFPTSKIVVAQPRRLGAECLCNRMRQLLPPEKVGLRMGFGVQDETSETQLWYMTVGYLARLLINNLDYLKAGDFLIFDEIHENQLEQDLLCFLAKQLVKKGVKIILMSATINLEHFQNYFGKNIPMIPIGKKPYPVAVYYLEELEEHPDLRIKKKWSKSLFKQLSGKKQIELTVEIISDLRESVLIFVAGLKDMYELAEKFKEKDIPCVLLHSQIERDTNEPFGDPNIFKVYIGTNIAESSITIPDLNLVICFGKEKYVENSTLSIRNISKASATQRAGRTGRTCPGTILRLYPKDLYKSFYDFNVGYTSEQLPQLILQLETISNKFSPRKILSSLPTPIEINKIDHAYNLLAEEYKMIEFQEDNTYKITFYGQFAIKISLQLEYVEMLALGCKLGCANTIASLVAIFINPPYVKCSYLDDNYYNKMRTYTKNRYKICADSEPLYNLKRYIAKPKKFYRLNKIKKSLEKHLPKDVNSPSDDLIKFIIGFSLRKNWLTGFPRNNFKNYALEIKEYPELFNLNDDNVFGVYSTIYKTNKETVFHFMDTEPCCSMLNKILITNDKIYTWHPEIVYDNTQGMNFVKIAFKERKNTNKLIKKFKKKRIDLSVTQKSNTEFEFLGVDTKFKQPIQSKKLKSYFVHIALDNISYVPMLMNAVASGFKDNMFRTHVDKPGIKFNYPKIFWKWNNINIWLSEWESSVVNKKIAVPGKILLMDSGNNGRAFNTTFLDQDLADIISTYESNINFSDLVYDKIFFNKINHLV